MTRLSEKQARELGLIPPAPNKNKYNARKTMVDGITFDSKREAEYYCELKLRVQAGELVKFDLQPEFILQKPFTHNGKKYRAIKYRADFKLYYKDGKVEVVDVKGHKTKEYELKKKLLLKKYPELWFTEVV